MNQPLNAPPLPGYWCTPRFMYCKVDHLGNLTDVEYSNEERPVREVTYVTNGRPGPIQRGIGGKPRRW